MTTELLGLCLLAGLVSAPVPLILSLLADDLEARNTPWSTSHLTLAILALWVIAQALAVTALGLLGRLSLAALISVEGAALVLGFSRLARRRRLAVLDRAALRAVAALATRSAGERWLLALGIGVFGLLFLQEFGLPTNDYDSLAYQLPRVVEWYQRGSLLDRPEQWAGWIDSYPFGWNTLFLLVVAPVGHDQWALLPNLVAWLILGLAIYGLARQGGGHRASALAAALVTLFMPVSVITVHSAHNDLPFAAFFLASAYFAIHATREGDVASFLLSAACAGMTLGCRMSAAGYLALLLGLWIWLVLFAARPARRWVAGLAIHRRPLLAALALASVAIVGASWYVRNLWGSGNPLGFFEVSVLGRVLWKGSMTRAFVSQTDLLHNFRPGDPGHWRILRRVLGEFVGAPGVLLAIGAACAARALRRPEAGRPVLAALLGLAAASLFLYLAGPWSGKSHPADPDITEWMGHQIRYSLPFWGFLAAVAGASVPPSIGNVLAGTLAAIVAVRHAALYTEFSHRRAALIFALGATLGWLLAGPAVRAGAGRALAGGRAFARRRPGPASAVALGVALVLGLGVSGATLAARERRQHAHEARFGGIGGFVARRLDPAARIGFWGSNQSYLLYGNDLSRRLRYLALDSAPTAADMIRYVRDQPVDVVAVGPRFASSPVWEWLAEHPEAFERIHGEDVDEGVVVYRVIRPGSRAERRRRAAVRPGGGAAA